MRQPSHHILRHLRHAEAGISLIEIVVALGIGVTVASMLTIITTGALKHVRLIKQIQRLQANATVLADTTTYWVKQGADLDVPSSTTLEISLPDSSTRVFAKNGARVTLDGNALTTDDIEVTHLRFTRMARSLRVAFTLKTSREPIESLSATTTIAQRNDF